MIEMCKNMNLPIFLGKHGTKSLLKIVHTVNQRAVDYCRQVKDAGVSLPSAVFMSSLRGSVAEMTRLNTNSETEQKGKDLGK